MTSKQQTVDSKQQEGVNGELLANNKAAICWSENGSAVCLLQYSRKPMHYVERKLPVVDVGYVHADRLVVAAGHLSR